MWCVYYVYHVLYEIKLGGKKNYIFKVPNIVIQRHSNSWKQKLLVLIKSSIFPAWNCCLNVELFPCRTSIVALSSWKTQCLLNYFIWVTNYKIYICLMYCWNDFFSEKFQKIFMAMSFIQHFSWQICLSIL